MGLRRSIVEDSKALRNVSVYPHRLCERNRERDIES